LGRLRRAARTLTYIRILKVKVAVAAVVIAPNRQSKKLLKISIPMNWKKRRRRVQY